MTNAEMIKRLRVQAAARGDCYTCRCRPAKPGRRNCQQCLDDVRGRRELLRAARRDQGRCIHCGVDAGGAWACEQHRGRHNKWQAKRYHDRKEAGLCTRPGCKKLARAGKILCAECAKAGTAANLESYHRAVARGECPICLEPWTGEEVWCVECRRKHRTRYPASRYAKGAA